MRHLLFQDFMYSAVDSTVNVVIFAAYSSKCASYFEMYGKRCLKKKEGKVTLSILFGRQGPLI